VASFLPTLFPAEIQRAAQVSTRHFIHHSGSPTYQTVLIHESYNPTSSHRLSPGEHRRLQSELYEFFGEHTAQVKISRYTANAPSFLMFALGRAFPTAHGDELVPVPFFLNITGRSISLSLGKVIPRKLFVAVCYLFFTPNIISLIMPSYLRSL